MHYGWNASIVLPSEKANDAINIVRAAKAAKITARLNLRIRRSYPRTQSVSLVLTGLRSTAPGNPLRFTPRPLSDGRADERQNNSPEKQIYRLSLESWKMQKT